MADSTTSGAMAIPDQIDDYGTNDGFLGEYGEWLMVCAGACLTVSTCLLLCYARNIRQYRDSTSPHTHVVTIQVEDSDSNRQLIKSGSRPSFRIDVHPPTPRQWHSNDNFAAVCKSDSFSYWHTSNSAHDVKY